MDPARPLLVFDGDCAFCTTSVRWLEGKLDRFPDAQPWQWLDLDEFQLEMADVTRYVWLIVGAQRYRGHLAFAAILRMQPSFWLRFLGSLMTVPPISWAGKLGYALVSRYRHRLPGGTAACALPRTGA